MTAPRLLVTGSRSVSDDHVVRLGLLWALNTMGPETVMVVGRARNGLDALAEHEWRAWGLTVDPFPADWAGPCDPGFGCRSGHRKINAAGESYCPLAGHRRNQAMVDSGADLCMAWPLGAARGTRDCMARAETAGIRVVNALKLGAGAIPA